MIAVKQVYLSINYQTSVLANIYILDILHIEPHNINSSYALIYIFNKHTMFSQSNIKLN